MKKVIMFVLAFLALGVFSGCNGETRVKNPPQFVEMYVNEETSPIVAPRLAKSINTGPKFNGTAYDEAIYSHQDFNIVVVTNGPNYDLLYSVELEDSLLGSCVYTNQSLLYKADATILVESDNSYTTEVSLTVPGSINHDSYLSDRTISLTKILFSRDTVDGTFPADIPSNTETILMFEIHAVNYFDEELGFPVVINEGYIDVILKEGTDEHTTAKNNEKADLVFPSHINEYRVRSLFLESLDWVNSLTIEGAFEHVYIIGNFDLLETLSISGVEHVISLINPTFKELAITGHFPLLESLVLNDCHGYRLFLKRYPNSVNDDYLAYCENAVGAPYSFPTLANIELTSCTLLEMHIGADTYGVAFPQLATVTFLQSTISYLYFGNNNNEFASLETISASESQFDYVTIAGFKSVESTPATLLLETGHYGFLELVGDAVGIIDADNVTFGGIYINSRSTCPSRLSNLNLSHVMLNGMTDSLRLHGNFPLLETISLSDFVAGQIIIGNETSLFPLLTSISLSNVTSSSLHIGDRDSRFNSLTHITIDNAAISNSIRIGYENAIYDALSTIEISNTTASSIIIGRTNDTFAALKLIRLDDITLTNQFEIKSILAIALEAIVINRVTMNSLSVMVLLASYHFYINNIDVSTSFYISDTCLAIYVPEDPSSSWIYHDTAVTLGIPVMTGTYSPPV